MNKQERRSYDRQYYLVHRTKCLEQVHRYQAQSDYQQWFRLYNRLYQRTRSHRDIEFRLSGNLRSRMSELVRSQSKRPHTVQLIGCSIHQLKLHLERQFRPGMSWDNYGQWHVDHIRPCASFDLSKRGDQQQCFHYTNLQPLWARDNYSKGWKSV